MDIYCEAHTAVAVLSAQGGVHTAGGGREGAHALGEPTEISRSMVTAWEAGHSQWWGGEHSVVLHGSWEVAIHGGSGLFRLSLLRVALAGASIMADQ